MMDVIIIFEMEKETKNTVRFQEVSEGKPPVIGTVYVQKWALPKPVPQKITVTLNS